TNSRAEIGSRPCHSMRWRWAMNESAAKATSAPSTPIRPGHPMSARMAWVEKPTTTAMSASVEVNRADPRNSVTAGGARVRRGDAIPTILRGRPLGLHREKHEEGPAALDEHPALREALREQRGEHEQRQEGERGVRPVVGHSGARAVDGEEPAAPQGGERQH